jgi:branched-subunit amino acid aminotransferase/4-amino-4-deoxychorismate lyase
MRTWLNGRLLQSPDEASVSVLDHGMIVGDGVFETIQISPNQPFALTRHLDRRHHSAHALGHQHSGCHRSPGGRADRCAPYGGRDHP